MADDAVTEGLRSEFELIFVYGAAGPHLNKDRRAAIGEAEEAHRDLRDALIGLLTDSERTVPQAGAAYPLSTDPVDDESATTLVSEAEDKNCLIWRSLLARADENDREAVLGAFTAAAGSAARWRRVIGESPSVPAFPGRP